jgi:hypothetical protein
VPKPVESHRLVGRWLHSHEEDTETETVYRRAPYSFPPSRGRAGFELAPDGTAHEIGIGPTDKPTTSRGQWRLDDDNQLQLNLESGGGRRLTVRHLDGDRLVIANQ